MSDLLMSGPLLTWFRGAIPYHPGWEMTVTRATDGVPPKGYQYDIAVYREGDDKLYHPAHNTAELDHPCSQPLTQNKAFKIASDLAALLEYLDR